MIIPFDLGCKTHHNFSDSCRKPVASGSHFHPSVTDFLGISLPILGLPLLGLQMPGKQFGGCGGSS